MLYDDRRISVSVFADGSRLDLNGYDVVIDSVDLVNSRDPNTASLTISNLGASNRGILSGGHQGIEISAGYVTPAMIFSGQSTSLRHIPPLSNAPGWTTVITAGDGIKAYETSWVSATWTAGTPISTVVGDIAATMGMASDCRFAGSLTGAWSFNGRSADAMSELVWDYGIKWMIYRGVVEVVAPSDSIDKSTSLAITVSSDTGMLGSPQVIEREPKGGKRRFGLSCMTMMNPYIRPDGLVKVRSAIVGGVARTKKGKLYQTPGVGGLYIVRRVNHYGSLVGNEFYTEFETESYFA